MAKKVKIIKEIPSKKKEITEEEKKESGLEEEISEVEEENFEEFVSTPSPQTPSPIISQESIEIRRELQGAPPAHAPEPALAETREAALESTPSYTPGRPAEEETEGRYVAGGGERAITIGGERQGRIIGPPVPRQQEQFLRAPQPAETIREEKKYEVGAVEEKKEKRRYPWER